MKHKTLLVVSNGHGEDAIGAELIRRLPSEIAAAAFPMVGGGGAYRDVCPLVGPRSRVPSGGSRVRRWSLLGDAGAMLASVVPALRFLHGADNFDRVLVIGDFIGVAACFFAGRRGLVYADVYRTGHGRDYWALETRMIAATCAKIFVRHDRLADTLRRAGADAVAAGNVMMDTIPRRGLDLSAHRSRPLALALLPGSRSETAANFALQVAALRRIPASDRPDIFLALAPDVDPAALGAASALSWDGRSLTGDLHVEVVAGGLGDVLDAADIVLSQAGTATTQAIGLGRPVVTMIHPGERRSRQADEARYYGEARQLVPAEALADAVLRLLADPGERKRRGVIGRDRVGPPGALDAILAAL